MYVRGLASRLRRLAAPLLAFVEDQRTHDATMCWRVAAGADAVRLASIEVTDSA